MKIILLFTLLQLANVILSTIKSVLTIKGGRITASIANAIYFGFYTIVVIQTTADNMDLWTKILITALTNLVGTYIGKLILDKSKKEKLWDINAAVKKAYLENVCGELNAHSLLHTKMEMSNPEYYMIHTYAKGKEESKIIRDIFRKYNAHVIVNEQDVNL